MTKDSAKQVFTNEEITKAETAESLLYSWSEKGGDIERIRFEISYENQIEQLQIELIKLQQWVIKTKQRIAIIFEGRDAAGKGGAIKRFVEHLNSRSMRVVALARPTELELGQWYFRRYIKQLPNIGEIVFFDRSWYNRAVVEPVMGFCNKAQYHQFMRQVTEFEHMLYEDGVHLIKYWFDIDKEEQSKRFQKRKLNPLKRWKLSPVDEKGQELWDSYSYYKDQMFARTHTTFSPWVLIQANNKRLARLESIRYVLSQFEYEGKENSGTNINPDPNIVMKYYGSNYEGAK